MARPNAWVCVAIAQALILTVAACGGDGKDKAKEELTPEAKLAQALDPCANPQGAFAEGLCKNADVAKLGDQIGDVLVEAASTVSPPGAEQLVQNEQRWLAAKRTECGMIDPDAAPTPEQNTCLQAALRERVAEAATSVQQVGGYTFQRVEITEATAVTAEAAAASGLGDDAPKAISRDIRFPRIDNASTPQAQRFNELVAQQPQFKLEDQTEEQVSYQIAYAGPELISVRFDTYDYTMGAAHPNNGVRAVTVVMTTGQPLAATDVFRAGSGWENFLTTRALRTLTAQFRDAGFTPPRADVRDAVTKPHLWLVKAEGLTLLFPPYSFGGPHALGGAEVTVPWADLARYLNPQAPQPIRAPA